MIAPVGGDGSLDPSLFDAPRVKNVDQNGRPILLSSNIRAMMMEGYNQMMKEIQNDYSSEQIDDQE